MDPRIIMHVFIAGFFLGVAAAIMGLSVLAVLVEGGEVGEASFGFVLALAAFVIAVYFLYLALTL